MAILRFGVVVSQLNIAVMLRDVSAIVDVEHYFFIGYGNHTIVSTTRRKLDSNAVLKYFFRFCIKRDSRDCLTT
ncbi:hypothetical protein [Vibrio breoganii]|uniref:hypothetical protein n=1 Tax=Vibrio breoganii TaxID=553239 RepID=UPI000C822F24|nr:hypothetical protein [Vibrio breoganii]PML10430.1 hypothetical protein BCT84_17360 [Vibrio breoganii]